MRHLTPEENERKKEMYRKMSTAVTDSDSMDFCGVVCNFAEGLIKKAKAEAIREFAERLKELKKNSTMDRRIYTAEMIDNLVKEMVGENNG
jgi:hypothetical protein